MKRFGWDMNLVNDVLQDLCQRTIQNKKRSENKALKEQGFVIKKGRPKKGPYQPTPAINIPIALASFEVEKVSKNSRKCHCHSRSQDRVKFRHGEYRSSRYHRHQSTDFSPSSESAISSSSESDDSRGGHHSRYKHADHSRRELQ